MDKKTSTEPTRYTVAFSGPDPGELAGFWAEYDKLADAYDKDLLKSLNNNLDSLLIFAGLFSSVNSSALFYSLSNLSADPADTTNALLLLLIRQSTNDTNAILQHLPGGVPAPIVSAPSYAPPNNAVQNNGFFAASLVTSLLAAFGAVLAKQWLLHYAQAGQVGALENQCRRRQKKFSGARRWHLRTVVELLPTLLQLSLLEFFIGLIDFFWSLDKVLAYLVLVLTGLGFLAYAFTVVVATKYPDAPFQSHVIELIRRTPEYANLIVQRTPYYATRFVQCTSPSIKALLPSIFIYIVHVIEKILSCAVSLSSKTLRSVSHFLYPKVDPVLPVARENGGITEKVGDDTDDMAEGAAMRELLAEVRVVDSVQPGDDHANEDAQLHRECVMWTLEVAERKESLREAARSIPTFRSVEACDAILRYPDTQWATSTAIVTTPAYNRLLAQLHASLLDAKAGRQADRATWADVILFGRALIHILLPSAPDAEVRVDAWNKLSKSWPTDEHAEDYEELSLVALSILPSLSIGPPEYKCSKIKPNSIPLYIACLVSCDTSSPLEREPVVRSLISACLSETDVPIEQVLVSARALKALADARRLGGGPSNRCPCHAFWDAYKSDVDVARLVIEAMEVIEPQSIYKSDRDFLHVVSTLLAQLTKRSTQYRSFVTPKSQDRLLMAIESHIQPGYLQNDALKMMDVLVKQSTLCFRERPQFHSIAGTIIAQICIDMEAGRRVEAPAIEFLKATSFFVVGIKPESLAYHSFIQHSTRWLRLIIYLSTIRDEPTMTLPNGRDEKSTSWSWALVILQTMMESPNLAPFWDAETIFRVLSSHASLLSEDRSESSQTVGGLMLPLLGTQWCRTLVIDRSLLREHPQAVSALVEWMKAPVEDLWIGGLVVVHHWRKEWLEHEEEDIHALFRNAGLAKAVIAPWRQGTVTKLDVYSERDDILEILASKPAWRDPLVEAFTQVVAKDKGWGGWKQAYRSMEHNMIWRVASIMLQKGQPHPDLNALSLLIPLLRMDSDKGTEDRAWFQRHPEIAGLLCFALQQSHSIGELALEAIDHKAASWFNHNDGEIHESFIARGMAQVLIKRLYPESHIGKASHKGDKILRVLLRSSAWVKAFCHCVVLDKDRNGRCGPGGSLIVNTGESYEDGVGMGPQSQGVEMEQLEIGLRARAVLDLHRLLNEDRSRTGLDVVGPWISDEALHIRVVIDYIDRLSLELRGLEHSSCWSYATSIFERRKLEAPQSLQQTPTSGTGSGDAERTKITFQCANACCKWTVMKPDATLVGASLGQSMTCRLTRSCKRNIEVNS
ncbi:hypothetical protein FRB96_005796 [Tulasnella sp. 330]|nr:hypothetical protein FRB96_005796 [Tulasnella sp. 330]